ncbi:MAG: CoA pyrophosphatase [Syntrophales bacterium]|nr:CoA pyrophosphatase [Syntrophales bacterium]
MDLSLPLQKDEFLELIVEKLGSTPLDFSERMQFIKKSWQTNEVHQAAGVLLPLRFRENPSDGPEGREFTFQLIKRSPTVAQPGDLSCPGGLLHRFLDPILRPFVTSGLVPILQGNALKYARKRDAETFRVMTLFLTNASRESWEEIRLSPWNVLFLGPLPTYSLTLYRRTIFPLVGFVKNSWPIRLNPEVDRVVEIPLNAFFKEGNYGLFYPLGASDQAEPDQQGSYYPCFIYRDDEGGEEILWGATFKIIISFLQIVLDYKLPDMHAKKMIKMQRHPRYLEMIKNRSRDQLHRSKCNDAAT